MAEGAEFVFPGGDEFLGDVALVADFEDGAHDGRIVDFLRIVELASAGISSGVIVPDDLVVLFNVSNDISVHHLNMINIKQQSKV